MQRSAHAIDSEQPNKCVRDEDASATPKICSQTDRCVFAGGFSRLAAVEVASVLQFLSLRLLCLMSATCSRLRADAAQPMVWKRYAHVSASDDLPTICESDREPPPWAASSLACKHVPVAIRVTSNAEATLALARRFTRMIALPNVWAYSASWTVAQVTELIGLLGPQLSQMELQGDVWLSDDVLSAVCALPSLQVLKLHVDQAKHSLPLSAAVHVTSLHVLGWDTAGVATLRSFAALAGGRLRKLTLQQFEVDIRRYRRGEGCTSIAEVAECMAPLLQQLDHIDLTNMNAGDFDAAHVQHFFECMPNVTRIDSFGASCDELLLPLLAAAEAGHLPVLRDLSWGYYDVDDGFEEDNPSTMQALAHAMPQLTIHLTIGGDGCDGLHAKATYAQFKSAQFRINSDDDESG